MELSQTVALLTDSIRRTNNVIWHNFNRNSDTGAFGNNSGLAA